MTEPSITHPQVVTPTDEEMTALRCAYLVSQRQMTIYRIVVGRRWQHVTGM